jgi:ATP-dependent protease HslVU (ClpYQ) peptidase subunit
MTCIVGLVEGNKVYIGGDSAGTEEKYRHQCLRKDKKVFLNRNFVIGGTSSFRMIQLLRYSFAPPVYEEGEDLECYMAVKFIDGIRECFKNGGYARKDAERESGGIFLVGFQGRLFCIEADYQVGESLCEYHAVGSGADIALGTLYATAHLQPLERIELALKAAEAHNAAVRAPFYIESI